MEPVTKHIEDGNVARARRQSVIVTAAALQPNTFSTGDETIRKMSVAIPDLAGKIDQAQKANKFESQMTILQGIRLYPKAILFSVTMSFAIVMEGYDTALLGAFWSYPVFNQRFGVPTDNPSLPYTVPSNWQSGIGNGCQVGEILGLAAAGWIAERYGYRKTIIGGLIMIIGCIFLFFFLQSIEMLLAAEVLAGIPWGAFQTLTTTYAADVTPIALRPALTSFVNLAWVIGQLFAIAVLRGLLGRTDEWGWRIPYALQWIWPVPIIVVLLFAPESPWWLVRNGRIDEAKKALLSLTSKKNVDFDVDQTISQMIYTNELETSLTAGTSYLDCFKGVNLRRTEIACMVWMCQPFSGNGWSYGIAYFMESAGQTAYEAFDMNIGVTVMGAIGTVLTWFVMPYVGRRTLYLYGMAFLMLALLVMGLLGLSQSEGALWATGAIMFLVFFVYDFTIGPVCYCLVPEIPSTRLRIKTAVLARNAYNIVGLAMNFLTAPILNPNSWNMGGKGAFVWFPFSVLALVWIYFRLPEPKGLSTAELDVLFEQGVSARKFHKVQADPFRGTTLEAQDLTQADIQESSEKGAIGY